jgi:tetraacyldisaccharide 4'-kinase
VSAALRLRISRGLEEGIWNGPGTRLLSRAWGATAARSLARPLVAKQGIGVVAVGGATLGGSGKTPLAIACARAVAETGARVVLVAHGYRARPGRARLVRPDDSLAEVGDEAIAAARALAGVARVVVAPSRQAAVDHAAALADVVVLDGVLQTRPHPAALSLLALDAESPWGVGEVVPRGDLRAPPAALLAVCDGAVVLGDRHERTPPLGGARWGARVESRGVLRSGEVIPWTSLTGLRVGFFTALARPRRLLAFLARRGVVPSAVLSLPDHGDPAAELPLHRSYPSVELWIASPKCALHLEARGVPHAVLEHVVTLDSELRGDLAAAVFAPT